MMKTKLLERFSKYVAYATTSDEHSTTYPSTETQLLFGDFLVEELKKIGLTEVEKNQYGYVTATLPANCEEPQPIIGFIAHLDTAPDMPSIDKPIVIENYDGEDIVLDTASRTILSVDNFPELQNYTGQTLLVTDGKTLLGADDKAGIAEIVCAMEYFVQRPEIKHGKLRVCFTPDEEIGQGTLHFDIDKFGCDYAYTIDGGEIGELEYENFNAASAVIKVQGCNIHPCYAKNKMVNAQLIAMEFNALLPEFQRPEHTQDYEGFFLLTKMEGTVENCTLNYNIREHDYFKFDGKKQLIRTIAEFLNEKYGNRVTYKIKDQYYNMREKIEPLFHIVERAEEAIREVGIEPKIIPIRGGTDGATLSFKGLPCPNIFTGGHNFHSKYEYISLEAMIKAVEVILNIGRKRE